MSEKKRTPISNRNRYFDGFLQSTSDLHYIQAVQFIPNMCIIDAPHQARTQTVDQLCILNRLP